MIGATSDSSKIGFRIVRNLLDRGYGGDMHLVNPKGGDLFGKAVLKSPDDLPPHIDLVFLAVPLKSIPAAVRACIRKSVRFVVALTAGFKETGDDGSRMEQELSGLIRESSTRLIGPKRLLETHQNAILLANAESHRFAIGYHRDKRHARASGAT